MTEASTETDTRSIRGVAGRVKPRHLLKLRTEMGAAQQSGKKLPPLPLSPSSWLKVKMRRTSRSTAASKDEVLQPIADDNDNEPTGAERVVLGQSGQKKVQVRRRASGENVRSLIVERQEASPI